MNVLNQIYSLSKGNPGATRFLMELMEDPPIGVQVFPKLEEYGLTGSSLYVLWSDLCDKDIHKVLNLIKKCPKEILVEACSREDYSGRGLVKEFL